MMPGAPCSAKELGARLGLGSWPTSLEPAGPGVGTLHLELPNDHNVPAFRAAALLHLLVSKNLDLVATNAYNLPIFVLML